MPLKLGQLLIKEKLITPLQLDEALKNHVVYGIKLGSSLMEMGYVGEEQLAQLLSNKLGVPRVGRREVASAPKEAIAKLSSDLAAKYSVIPFALEQNRLSVAMSDPTDFRSIEELGFNTGCIIKTFIAPDVLISKALAKFYHVSAAETRYHMIPRRNKTNVTQQAPQTVTFPMKSASGELLNVTVPADFGGFGSLPDTYGCQTETQPAEHASDPVMLDELRFSTYSIDQLSMDFAGAGSRDDVADVFIRYLGQEFNVGAIFIVHGDQALGWRGISSGKRLPGFEKLNMMLNKPSILADVMLSRNFAIGPIVDNPCNRQILYLLKAATSSCLMALPVIMQENVVAIVLVSADRDTFRWRMMELEKLVYKMSLAFEKLIIKQKILMT